MLINVFKFGGASVNSANGLRNVADILRQQKNNPLVVVLSAMGKTTNSLEELLKHFIDRDSVSLVESYHRLKDFHFNMLHELFPDKDHAVFNEVEGLFEQLRGYLRRKQGGKETISGLNFEYDQIVVFGELFSTRIAYHYLLEQGIPVILQDARELIKTDRSYQDAAVDWSLTRKLIDEKIHSLFDPLSHRQKIVLTQGFIGSDPDGKSTTLGREGSDFTAAIFAYSLGSKEVTIWKDVPGVMNADPKWMKQARKLETLSYREAIELAYFGASIIHPKTIKPLENANIKLRVRSFLHPEENGTIIENMNTWKIPYPVFIRKQNQVLISVSPKDFSFIQEDNLSQIFNILAKFRVKVNVMQNSAISFSICVDANHQSIQDLITALRENYSVLYNDGLELITIRHYHPQAIRQVTRNKTVLLEQKTRNTVHFIINNSTPAALPENHNEIPQIPVSLRPG